MKKKTYRFIPVTLLTASLLLSGCGNNSTQPNQPVPADPGNQQTADTELSEAVELNVESIEVKLTEKDQDSSYDEASAVKIDFNGTTITTSGDDASVEGSTVTISKGGTYILSGNGSGQIVVLLTDDSEKVQLVLNNLTLTNSESAALLIGDCDKVFITLPVGTVSSLSDGSSYTVTFDDSDVDGTIFAKSDVTINGTGTLNITGNYKHGIVCKDDLRIYQAKVNVEAAENGIVGKDSLEAFSTELNINAGGDGLKASNDEDETKGFIYINESTITVKATDKGLQAETFIIINSGKLDLNTGDDGLNSTNTVLINEGNISINSSDDGIHGDYRITVNGGTISVNAHEGIEATVVTIEGGDITIKASDDGINAGQKVSGVTPTITINGGTLTIDMGQGDTDAIDSNGDLIINGGEINITAQSPFDYDGQGQLNGGTVTVNGQQITQLTSQFGGGGMMPGGQQPNGQMPGGQQPGGKQR